MSNSSRVIPLTNFSSRGSVLLKPFVEDQESVKSSSSSSNSSISSGNQSIYSKDTDLFQSLTASHRRLIARKHLQVVKWQARMKVNDTLIAIIALSGLGVALIEYQDNYEQTDEKDRNTTSFLGHILRTIVSISTIVLLGLLFWHSKLSYKIRREKQVGFEINCPTYLRSSQFHLFLVEFIINLIHWPPGIDIELTFEQLSSNLVLSMDAICVCIMLLRVYHLLRLIKYSSKWSSNRSSAICDAYGCEANSIFVVKSMLKDYPYIIVIWLLILTTMIFAIAIRIFERPFTDVNLQQSQDFSYIWNSMWVTILTMTTVGYGDFFPRTHIGRGIGVLACFCGVFLISLTVLTMTTSTEFSKGEVRAFDYMKRIAAKEKSRSRAGLVVKYALMLNYYKNYGDEDIAFDIYKKMMNYLKLYKEFLQWYLFREAYGDMTDEDMLRAINDKINLNMNTLNTLITQARELNDQLNIFQQSQKQTQDVLLTAIRHTQQLNMNIH